MRRKDCEKTHHADARECAGRPVRVGRLTALLVLAACAPGSLAHAGSVRLWSAAVIVDDTVRLLDLCELRGFDPETERMLAELVVTDAPPPGGSRVIHLEMIRTLLAASGANMAMVTMGGATRCAVTRPSDAVSESDSVAHDRVAHGFSRGVFALKRWATRPRALTGRVQPKRWATRPGGSTAPSIRIRTSSAHAGDMNTSTLQQAIIDYFDGELARYGGTADIVFDHTSQQLLDLSSPAYQFKVRRRGGAPLGLIQLEVDVLAKGRTLQTVPLVVQVSLIRRVVIASRSVNQGATIHASDVAQVPLSFTRLDKLGIDDVARTIGQRAKRFISAGSLVDPGMLESVPLVTRGQLVRLTSVAGAVRVVTSAKALRDGLLGETITVRSADKKRVELDAVVVGPGTVRIGSGPAMHQYANAAMGGRS